MNELVSIGLPVRNGGEYLEAAIDSLLSQSYADIEVLISDNASTDATESICRNVERRDPRVTYLRQDRDIGSIANFDVVLQMARAKFFMWAAHDDVWNSEFISTLMASMLSDRTIGLVQAEVTYIRPDGLAFPHFAEGPFFRSPVPRPGQTRVIAAWSVANKGYGNLIYGIYRKQYLYTASGSSVLSGFRAETMNELPVFLNVVLNGGRIKVIAEPLMWKRTILNTYVVAAVEAGAGYIERGRKRLSAREYIRNVRYWVRSLSYHRHALADIRRVVDDNAAGAGQTLLVGAGVSVVLYGHYLKVVILAISGRLRPATVPVGT